MQVTREQVLAYRMQAQGLHRDSTDLAVLDIGVQDGPLDQARLSFDARLPSTPPADRVGPGRRLALVWSLRGAPHVHRRADLDAVAGALYPLSEADACGRLNETGPSVARAGIPALQQFELALAAMRKVITEPMAKGAASAGVTKALPDVMGRDCRPCKARHVSDSAMRSTALAAGLELQPGTSPPVLQPRPKARLPHRLDPVALRSLITAYLRLLGPATDADVAGYLGARRADLDEAWPDDLVEVTVDGRSCWLPSGVSLDVAPREVVRLLGGFDPYLQARDRDLIVPDKAVQKVLWPVLGRPGAVLVDGEVLGMWRPKAAGKKLALHVEAVAPLPSSTWELIEAEALRVGAVRGIETVSVVRV
ncbi:winged helix DNA-binding domain-containing protein [Jatrophihabitans sp.]|uniref:winged helix DNA-binding domain-containing protein n=1 Tax=Jatrophihabitans sp. TaxID=1932789 RepID=UPI0030C6EA25|nr:Winged helix DNA-binding protein [Jatrophihabitans sp.]